MDSSSDADARPILVVNAGSSSLKVAFFDRLAGIGAPGQAALRLEISALNTAPVLTVRDREGRRCDAARTVAVAPGSCGEALACLLERIEEEGHDVASIAAVGHRVVHGGELFTKPTRIDEAVVAQLEQMTRLAPHHLPPNIAGIKAMAERLPGVPQVACFDTAFHATQPPEARLLPLPRDYLARGFRRYGFHGLSYAYVAEALPTLTGEPLPPRIVAAHLGNGASLCAMREGRSIATTMGYSTLDGLVMGTRSGAIDPGVLIELIRADGLSAAGLEDLLYNRSGLLGVSGISGDMQTLLRSRKREAVEAIGFYCYSAARHIASMMAALGGCDAIVFTGGIGENAAPVRAAIVERLAWAGALLDKKANAAGRLRISSPKSAIAIFIVETDEAQIIARQTWAALRRAAAKPARGRKARSRSG